MKLSEFIQRHRAGIAARIVATLRESSPDLKDDDVPGSVPAALGELLLALERDEAGLPRPAKSESGTAQGRQRQRIGTPIDAVAHDFGAVCDAVMAEGLARGYTPSAREFQILNLTIDEAIAAAAHEYWARARAEHEHATSKRVGMLVHELRNTLQGVQMAFKALPVAEAGGAVRSASIVERGLKRMANLIDHALAAVKLDAGMVLAVTRVKVIDLIHEVEAASVPSRGITLSVQANDDLELDADPSLIASALGNLVANALKFTRDRTVITIRARAEGLSVVVEVEDECGGLPPGRPEDLFAAFVQRGEDRRGVGLGLAIVREATEAHGGKVGVRDLPGKGCVFSLTLPRAGREYAAARPG